MVVDGGGGAVVVGAGEEGVTVSGGVVGSGSVVDVQLAANKTSVAHHVTAVFVGPRTAIKSSLMSG